ncbi:ABC transporter ATP-binding protein [Nocardioides daphniae]|uniref:ABC transporter ATP-binding protein n=1 Tax=Nocardioides daphniae TaxID=402297 RepID=A0A4P7UFX8_9ACTN|nr:ABC transporter ATP-binding protein [Nocardioides daphniae]QCC78178.1 ABC transporter ATP-binding protein [Nocardioides daphniae]GGD21256.1 multidrug ABC transporter ATP-binding protein [Nocardioides daphniae]
MLLRLVRDHLRPYRGHVAAVVALQLAATLSFLFLPSINAEIIDDGVVPGDIGFIWQRGGVMLAVAAAQTVCQVAAVWFAARMAMSLGRDLRAELFARVGTFSARELQQFGAPSLITRGTNDVQQVQMLVLMASTMMVMAPIMMVGGLVMAIREDVGLSWLLAALIPVMGASIGFVVSRMIPSFKKMQGRIDEVNRLLREQVTGVRVVRAFVRERHEEQRFAEANADLTQVAVTAGRWMASMFPIVTLVSNVATVGVIWFGGHRVDSGAMEIGAITAYISYVMQIVMSVMLGTFMLMQLPRATVCAERIAEVLDTRTSVVPPADPVTEVTRPGHLDLDDVTFCYPGAASPVLQGVSLAARPGETLAVIGSTGSGKSTLVNLVPRLFDVTDGRVCVGGVDVRDLEPEVLWAQLGLVPQKAFLFSGTVASNLRQGKPDATEEEMWAALDVAQASDFVRAMPDGLESPIAQGGTNVSGGQRQRLAIARAVIRRPAIYLFDDAFSALDLATDARLRRALAPITRDATVVIVAQRVATIRHADRIVVLEDGRVVGQGSHEELLETCATYQEIVTSQRAGEEAA